MKTQHTVTSPQALLDAISAGSSDPTEKGPEVVTIMIDGKKVVGSYTKKDPDICTPEDILWSDAELQPFVDNLLKKGVSFTTQTGSDDMVCTLKWTIE